MQAQHEAQKQEASLVKQESESKDEVASKPLATSNLAPEAKEDPLHVNHRW